MTGCSKCNAALAQESAYCSACGEPTNKKQQKDIQGFTSKPIVCPFCKKQILVNSPSDGHISVQCPNCRKQFQTLLATVRAKRSRGSKKEYSRDFDLRVKHSGREELINFSHNSFSDIELRQNDAVALTYDRGRLVVVQNLTINQHRVVGNTWRELILGAVVLGCIVWYFMSGLKK